MTPTVSVVLPTYNRKAELLRALDCVLAQQVRRAFEVIVVDNNSTDGTRDEILRAMTRSAVPVRYLLEQEQGVSYARNAGIAAAQARIVAFVDDDVRVRADWLETILDAFERHPEVECIGGKVLPEWQECPPNWLTRDHWGPLALLDQGEAVRRIDTAEHGFCLLTANMACRRETFDRVGLFRKEFQRVKDGIGSLEDHEWLLRFWAAGGRALYVPEACAFTEVPATRTARAYHRRWHSGHGHYFALLRDPAFEASTRPRLFDVPAHAYRSAMRDALVWAGRLLQGDAAGAFLFETRLRFFAGYFVTRAAECLTRQPRRSVARALR